MTSDQTADYGRILMESLRMAGVSEQALGYMMAGYAMACLVANFPAPPPLADILPIANQLLEEPPEFKIAPPKVN